MKTEALKVIVIDGDQNSHQKYESYFETFYDYQLVGTFRSVHDALQNYRKYRPDIVLSEVSLFGISGIEGIQYLHKKDDNVKIILLSPKNDFDIVRKAFKAGANGYLTKPVTKTRILAALNSVRENGAALSHDVARTVVEMFQKKKYEALSKRENQIAEYLGQGATYKSIAEKLYVTPSTVNFHIQNIYLKLNVNSKSAALEKLRMLEAS
ncbi:response regulator transcription factor [Croceitalea sp. MTPC9]|uniref:response regulator transcription factor n=1 Tax=unclassified Croceitalea TaxID=2632280 RepID=UPI002B394ADD|nr:response regulator transcription factor [Croceitalea sp. MTPC6]GMN15552.1 response regulator transcription factor [Croceitalea sp. MTPC9]